MVTNCFLDCCFGTMESVVLVTGLGEKEATGLLTWNQRLQILRGAGFVVLATVRLFCTLQRLTPYLFVLGFPCACLSRARKGKKEQI